jgi:hypothetical protein
MFAAALLPEAKGISPMKRFTDRLFGFNKSNREQETESCTTSCLYDPNQVGWDHTNMKRHYLIWPELDLWNGSRMKLKLDWEDGNGHDSETSNKSVG